MNFARRTPLTALASIVLGASGLMASTQVAAKEVTIWAWDPNFNIAIMQEAAKRYTAKHPDATFKIVDMAKADLEQKLQTTLASGASGSPPTCTARRCRTGISRASARPAKPRCAYSIRRSRSTAGSRRTQSSRSSTTTCRSSSTR